MIRFSITKCSYVTKAQVMHNMCNTTQFGISDVVKKARILKSGITLVHPYFRNKSHKQDCLFFLLAFNS